MFVCFRLANKKRTTEGSFRVDFESCLDFENPAF